MFRSPDQVVETKYDNSNPKWDQSKVFIGVIIPENQLIKSKEFTNHPIWIRTDPNSYGQIMT